MSTRMVWALLVALLWAGQVQAWHAPAHIDDFRGDTVHQEATCVLGVNGHGAAVPPTTATHPFSGNTDVLPAAWLTCHAPHTEFFLLPPLRGPPVFR